MAALILLNGPPASGKSTIAAQLIERRPSALNLDIDALRSQREGWQDNPMAAGLAARATAIFMARAHLLAGHDVVIPQFLGRLDFIEELAELAAEVDALFVELMLELDREGAIAAFNERSSYPENQTHRDAAFLVEMSTSRDPLGDMYDAAQQSAKLRPATCTVAAMRGDIDRTVISVIAALAEQGVAWS